MSFLKFVFKNVFGSFFRSFGRFIFYFLLGLLLALIFNKNVYAATTIYQFHRLSDFHVFTSSYNNKIVSPTFYSGNQNTVGFGFLVPFVTSKGRTYNFDVTFVYEVYQSKGVLKDFCSNSPMGAEVYLDSFNNSQLNVTNRNWSRISCAYNDGNTYANYSFSGSFVATSTAEKVNFNFPLKGSYDYSNGYLTYTISNININVSSDPINEIDIIENNNQNKNDIINNNNQNTQDVINNQDKNQQQTNDRLEEVNDTNKSILQILIDLPKTIFDFFIGLFIPDNFDFINGLLDSLSDKLGFIAQVPIKITDFFINLAKNGVDDINSITMPGFSVLGYDLWQDLEIDLTSIKNVLSDYIWVTDSACVVLFIKFLYRLKENFANGGA